MVVLREESCRGDDDRRGHHERGDDEVHGHRHPAGDHRRADECAGNGPEAEAGVESGHDGSTELLLDEGAVHVDRHVPGAGREPEEEQADHDRCDADPVTECHRQQRHAEQGCRDDDRPARSEAGDHRAGQGQGEERTDGDREQDQAELGRFEVESVTDLGDPRRPRGDGEARTSERHIAGDHGPLDPAQVGRGLDVGRGCHRLSVCVMASAPAGAARRTSESYGGIPEISLVLAAGTMSHVRFFDGPDTVRRARQCLDDSGFTLDALTERLGIHAFAHLALGELAPLLRATRAGDRLDTLLRLFVVGLPVSLADARAALGPLCRRAMGRGRRGRRRRPRSAESGCHPTVGWAGELVRDP